MPTDAQNRYWKTMVHLQVHIYYLAAYLLRFQRIERRIGYFLAVAASASIGGWAVWQKYWVVWAIVIATSQVLNAIRHLLPYQKRIKVLQGMLPELNRLLLDAERGFYDVSQGGITDEAIHSQTIEIKARKSAIVDRLDECAFGDSAKYLATAEVKAERYFQGMYGNEEV